MADLAIGVIGAGGMGSRHALNLHHEVAGATVAAIYDLDQERATRLAAECGGARACSDPMQLIGDAAVDAVLIASPDPTHAAFVHACLRLGKPVLCEKPMATTAADARSIVEAEEKGGRRLVAVGFMRRFDPQHVALRQAIVGGEIGRPILFKGVHRNPMPPHHLPGRIVITNSAIHDIDSCRWLLGQEVIEVLVHGVRTHGVFSAETRDMLLFQMVLQGDCLATIETSVAVEYGYEVSAEVVGERGAAMTQQPDDVVIRARSRRHVAVPESHLERFQNAFRPEVTAWVRSIRSDRPFNGASAWDGYMSALVTDACIESLASGKPAPVRAPERPALYRTADN